MFKGIWYRTPRIRSTSVASRSTASSRVPSAAGWCTWSPPTRPRRRVPTVGCCPSASRVGSVRRRVTSPTEQGCCGWSGTSGDGAARNGFAPALVQRVAAGSAGRSRLTTRPRTELGYAIAKRDWIVSESATRYGMDRSIVHAPLMAHVRAPGGGAAAAGGRARDRSGPKTRTRNGGCWPATDGTPGSSTPPAPAAESPRSRTVPEPPRSGASAGSPTGHGRSPARPI